MRMGDDLRGADIAARMDRLGISARELAQRVDLDRQSVTRAREGKARPATFGAIEAYLDRLEGEIGPDDASRAVTTIELPGGIRVTYKGGTPEEAARFAQDFLAGRETD
jgi:DNA-binding Xre family transcriptional regulator